VAVLGQSVARILPVSHTRPRDETSTDRNLPLYEVVDHGQMTLTRELSLRAQTLHRLQVYNSRLDDRRTTDPNLLKRDRQGVVYSSSKQV
jgi:hypothetical protein